MKRVSIVLLGILLCVLLAGCKCEHEWAEATCTEPKTCTKCKETEGEPLGHNWKAATCEEPEICTRCGETRGNAKGHTWKDATCTAPKTCSVCGKTEGKALGHTPGEAENDEPDYISGTFWRKTKCTVCGETIDNELRSLLSFYENGKFILSADEFTERLGKLYPYIKDCTYTTQVVVTDDNILGSVIFDGSKRVGIITYLGDGASTGSNRAKRNSFTGLLCAFDTDDTDVVMKASIGIIMGLNPQFEVSDAAKVVKQTVVSMASVSQPYYKDGIGYVLGQADDGDFQLVLSLEE